MNNKESILTRIRENLAKGEDRFPMPDIDLNGIRYDDPVSQFAETLQSVGGRLVNCAPEDDKNLLIKGLFPKAGLILSDVPGLSISTLHPDNIADPHELKALDLTIVQGHLGVAENACVWLPQTSRLRAHYFIAEHLVILLDASQIVQNMHEAYERIADDGYDFGVFISGPSKTADIEQALVVGAHGARSATVILTHHIGRH